MIPVLSQSLISSAVEQTGPFAGTGLASSFSIEPSRPSWQMSRVGSLVRDPVFVGGLALSLLSPCSDMGLSAPLPMAQPSENLMRQTSSSPRTASVSDPTVVGEQTCTFLRKLYPRATAENVAADLRAWRVKSATIAKMLERRSTPSTHLWIALTCFYGPEFLCSVLSSPPAWMDAARREARQADLERRIAALKADLERLS